MEDRPKSNVCSLCLKLATVGDKITLSGREFHTFTTRLEKKWPSLADSVWTFSSFMIFPRVGLRQTVEQVKNLPESRERNYQHQYQYQRPLCYPLLYIFHNSSIFTVLALLIPPTSVIIGAINLHGWCIG